MKKREYDAEMIRKQKVKDAEILEQK